MRVMARYHFCHQTPTPTGKTLMQHHGGEILFFDVTATLVKHHAIQCNTMQYNTMRLNALLSDVQLHNTVHRGENGDLILSDVTLQGFR